MTTDTYTDTDTTVKEKEMPETAEATQVEETEETPEIVSSTEIVWSEPPGRGGGESIWDKRLAPVQENPENWARVYYGKLSTARSTAGTLKQNYPDFRFKSRSIDVEGTDEKAGGVWAIYMGYPASDEEE